MDKHGFIFTLEDYLKILNIAKEKGKKEGESLLEEVIQYMKKSKKGKYIGEIKDIDLLKGNLRENGFFKILDLRDEKEKDKD